MMSGFWRLATTGFIWLMVASVLVFSEPGSGEIVWLALILAGAAAFSTRFIWNIRAHEMTTMPQEQVGKAKRTNRITRLMDLLDEDEIADLEAWMDARQDRRTTANELME